MGILQENRFDAPQVQSETTDYGAEYVNVATETPVAEKEEMAAEPEPQVSSEETPKRKGGRPKKGAKK